MSEKVDCFGVGISQINISELLSEIERCVFQRHQLTITYVNFHTTNIIHRSQNIYGVFKSFDIIVPDGIALKWALRCWGCLKIYDSTCLYVEVEPCLPDLYLIAVKRRWGMYFLGSEPGLAAQSAANLKKAFPDIKIVGTRNGYIGSDEALQDVIRDINNSEAVILLVGMGQPKQEEWIIANRHKLKVSIIVAIGGYFDKFSKKAEPYPDWVKRYHLFWLYRLFKEPKRLWKRYTFGIAVFALRVLWVKFKSISSHTNRR